MAGMGSKNSPVMLPVWKDMDPESEFFQSICRHPLPSDVDAYLFFSHRGSHNLLRSNPFFPNNDGVITLSSQLDLRLIGRDDDRDLGPFPTGNYQASLFSDAFRSSPGPFIDRIKNAMGAMAKGRFIQPTDGAFELREAQSAYTAILDPEKH